MVEIGMEVEIGVRMRMRMRMEMSRRTGLYQCTMEMDARHVCACSGGDELSADPQGFRTPWLSHAD
jgi:hypothetical protein